MEKVADRLKIQNLKKGDVLYQKGEKLASKIAILHQGSLSSVTSSSKKILQNSFFCLGRKPLCPEKWHYWRHRPH
mgnify:CR=1 FL=1